jgi:EAL domain-containing protein (putative c-di-GMP-specific phosphodiesterase class I)/ActR/RegA family two-component response regulator
MSEAPQGRVLVVDDDDIFLRVCVTVLRRAGLAVDPVSSATEALERIRAFRYDAIVSDIRMPGSDGIALLRAARSQDSTVPFVLMTGAPTVESAILAVDHGAAKYLQKPFDVDHFLNVVTAAVARRVGASDLPSLHRRLDRALEKLWMAYQPIVRCASGSLLAYEALMRCNAEEIGGPGDVLDLAERTSRIFDLGRTIRGLVATDIDALEPSVLAFVNLHPVDLEDPELYSRDAPLTRHAKRVVLEVTERASVSHSSALDEHMRDLRALGYRIAVDDLGAGYAGLTTFARVRPEFVKLDASLVRDIDSGSVKRTVVSAVVDLARALESQVVAEAIETANERDTLRQLGIDVMQGYYFAKPAKPFVRIGPDRFDLRAA